MKWITKNKRAYFEYEILEKLTAGIQLQGSEVKSVKASKVSIVEAIAISRMVRCISKVCTLLNTKKVVNTTTT